MRTCHWLWLIETKLTFPSLPRCGAHENPRSAPTEDGDMLGFNNIADPMAQKKHGNNGKFDSTRWTYPMLLKVNDDDHVVCPCPQNHYLRSH